MYHIFEYKLNVSGNGIFSDCNDYNPKDFEYTEDVKTLNDEYVYDNSFNQDNQYFVTKYSKTSEKEDRAEIFAEIMTFKSKPEYLYAGSNINKKAKYITNIMTDSLTDENNSYFYWNRF
jgi:hypothetical protein